MSKSLVLLLAAAVGAQTPAVIEPPKDQTLLFKLVGRGSQVYVCQSGAWVFKAPEAKLFDEGGELAGHHFAGPTWEAKDGSQVKGKMVSTVASPVEGAVPWLLLTATSHQSAGSMAAVQSIQRLETKGGKAPNGACKEAQENQIMAVPYEANYYFYGAR